MINFFKNKSQIKNGRERLHPDTSTKKPTANIVLNGERPGAPPRPATRQRCLPSSLQHQSGSLKQRHPTQRRYKTDVDNLQIRVPAQENPKESTKNKDQKNRHRTDN